MPSYAGFQVSSNGRQKRTPTPLPTVITHAVVGANITVLRHQSFSPLKFALVAASLAVLPDLDVLGFRNGIAHSDMFGHRGITHSLLFAALLSAIVALIGFREIRSFSTQYWILTVLLFLATASHGVLDSMTNAGLGVGFLIPFDNERYFAPWRPLTASPLSISRFFSGSGVSILANELRFVGPPVAAFAVIGIAVRRWLRGVAA